MAIASGRRRAWLLGVPLLLLALAAAFTWGRPAPANAAPYFPEADEEVLETLPGPVANSWLRSPAETAVSSQSDAATAVARARVELEHYRESADPRYLGRAEAALGRFWDEPSPPEPVLVLRARIRQSNHEFLAALSDLDQALVVTPNDGQALLDRASIRTVLGRYDAAGRDCQALEGRTAPLYVAVCRAAIAGVTGSARTAVSDLSRALSAPGAGLEDTCWAESLLAELSTHLGDATAAEAHFRGVLSACPSDSYAQGALADLWLDLQRNAEVVSLLSAQVRQDALLLRLAIAEQRLKSADFASHFQDLKQRFEEAQLRGSSVHRREEARFELALRAAPRTRIDARLGEFPGAARDGRRAHRARGSARRGSPGARARGGRLRPRLRLGRSGRQPPIGEVPVIDRALVWLAFVFVLLAPALASAHKPSDSYLMLEKTANGLQGRWDIALRDLEPAVGLDADHDGMLTWGELKARLPVVTAYAATRLRASTTAGACRMAALPQGVVAHSDGKYLALSLAASCAGDAASVTLVYDLLFDIDAQHRGVLRYTDDGKVQPLRLRQGSANGRAVARHAAFFRHRSSGCRAHSEWLRSPVVSDCVALAGGAPASRWRLATGGGFRTVLLDVLRTVTAFTLAHSLTLALSAAHWVVLPSRFVESAIAASIVLAALNNLCPVLDADRSLAFGLGLLHGFGFAAVLATSGYPGKAFYARSSASTSASSSGNWP